MSRETFLRSFLLKTPDGDCMCGAQILIDGAPENSPF